MRNLPRTLAFLTALLLASGCSKKISESPDNGPTTASPTASTGSTDVSGAPTDTSKGAPQEKAGPSESTAPSDSPARQALESCVERWLSTKGLDAYGNAEGTMYAGGTPLFDERTGEMRDRLDYIFERQPGARQACAPPDGN